MVKGISLTLLSFLLSCLARTYADLLIIQKSTMSSTLMSLVPILNGSMNWQAWWPMMMNYLLSQGQWKVIQNKFPAPDYETRTVCVKEGETETTQDTSKPAKNQSEIDLWFDINDKALRNIMLCLHPTIATTALNLLQKTMEDNTDVNTMFASLAWEYLEKTYGKPGIAATYKELKATMDVVIPGNADPTLTINTILIGFTRMAASKCAVPPHLQAMILVSKLPYQMSALVQSICQTDDIEDLKTDDIKHKAILAWEQRSPTQNNRPQQPQATRKISASNVLVPPSFQQQQQQPQQEEQQQGNQNQNPQQGGWRGGRGGRGGTFRGTHAGKNKQNQQQQAARPIEEHAPSPTPSFVFGKFASPVVVPDTPRSVYPNFTNALSLAHRIGVKPTIETVKRLEVVERTKEEQRSLNRPNKHPRVNREDEVSLYWSSDDDIEMFLDNSAGPSSRCTRIASPLDATNLFPSGYNTLLATIETTSIVPYVENTICCPNVISDFAAEDHMNRVDWILDSGASLHFTGDMNDFIEYTPLEKNITANTATSANTQIIGKGTVMMAVEGSKHMVRIAPVFYVPDLSMCLLSLGVFLRGGLQLNGNTECISLLQNGQEFLTFLPRWDGATIFIIRTYLGTKPSIRAAEQIFHPDFETYHRRFVHPSNDVLHKIGKYTNGLPSQIQIPENHICPKLTQVNLLNLFTWISNPSLWSPITSTNMQSYSWMISPPTLGL